MAFRTKALMILAALVLITSWSVAGDHPEHPSNGEHPSGGEHPAAADGEMVDNPQYATWSSFQVGAMAKMSMVTTAGGQQIVEMVTTQTLTSLDDTMAVVSMQTSMVAGGQTIEQPAIEVEVLAQVPASTQQPPGDVEPEIEQGEETIDVPAGTFACQRTTVTVTMTVNDQEFTSVSTTWTSDQVPGGQVKMVAVTNSQMGEQTTASELLEHSAGGE